jgi:hypothetical protein
MYNPLWRQRFLIHWFMFMCLTVFKKIWKFDRALSTGTDPPSISCWVNLLVPNKLSYLFPKGWTTKPINNESKICFCYIFRRNVQYFRAQRPFYINIYLFITKWYGRNGDKVGGWQLRCRISVTLAKACSTTGLLHIERMTHLSFTIRIGEGTVSIYVSHPFRRVFTLSKKRTSIPFLYLFFLTSWFIDTSLLRVIFVWKSLQRFIGDTKNISKNKTDVQMFYIC